MINWPRDLVDDIARRRCVIFLGAGVSKNASNAQGERPMDWIEFLRHLAGQIADQVAVNAINECIAGGDLLTACEVARTALRPANFRTELLRCFSERRFQPAQIHENLVGIDSRIVLTTNVDKLYDMAANTVLHGDVIVKSHVDSDVGDIVRRQNRCVIKIHGTIDAPANTIFTRVDYADARNKYAHFYRVIDALFMTHTFLFLGASMRDPDMALILEDYALRYHGARPHYVVMPAGAVSAPVLGVLEQSMNLQTISYNSANNHAELNEGVALLKTQVEEARGELLETMNW
ncbi:SIR2 family protein [Burkholderia cepacia]|uniref:SIR2 family NAD-dependent protein deacylase n=1 Tax=Burkholderia cepacia complex TaxID=87882 RepID=UPI00157B3C50|nr:MULTISPECIES: SIR2 family protein [Burkholderia cepacia complex]MBR8218301.1 SIR2 family protein [Burkholderia vietnamiensis]NTX48013.1 SIR2 family protein [Burkholderia cepacia]